MKTGNFLLMAVFLIANALPQNQNEVRASMGIDFISVPGLKDYLEANYTERLSDFSSAVNFSGAYGRMIGESSQVEFELGYLLNSYNAGSQAGNYDLTYSLVMPSLLYNFVISGSGYNFKFGGGGGIRFLSLTERRPADPNEYNYSSSGYGIIIRAAGNTAISRDVFAHIGADVRYDIPGKLSENTAVNDPGNINFNSLSFGLRLGISYQF